MFGKISNFRKIELKFTNEIILPDNFIDLVEASHDETDRILDLIMIEGESNKPDDNLIGW